MTYWENYYYINIEVDRHGDPRGDRRATSFAVTFTDGLLSALIIELTEFSCDNIFFLIVLTQNNSKFH